MNEYQVLPNSFDCLCVILLGHMNRGTDRETDKHILIFSVLITINFGMISKTALDFSDT